jgi:hypothetical protein
MQHAQQYDTCAAPQSCSCTDCRGCCCSNCHPHPYHRTADLAFDAPPGTTVQDVIIAFTQDRQSEMMHYLLGIDFLVPEHHIRSTCFVTNDYTMSLVIEPGTGDRAAHVDLRIEGQICQHHGVCLQRALNHSLRCMLTSYLLFQEGP